MQLQNTKSAPSLRTLLFLLPLFAVVIWQRMLILQLFSQLLLGAAVALAALPLARPLEKRMKRSRAAALAIAGLIVLLASLLLLLIPFLVSQTRQIATSLPGFIGRMGDLVRQGERWLTTKGVHIDEGWKNSLLSRGEALLEGVVKHLGSFAQSIAGSLGRWLLSPVFAFYLLRDRREISEWVLMLFPSGKRPVVVRIFREMRRETLGFLRAQLMISAAIGSLTAVGLLLCGIPGWLFLGLIMAVLELIPYMGPVVGGGIVLLFSWQKGLGRMLWALGVIVLVQQIEGNLLSPKMTSQMTRLHPLTVLLGILAGGSLAGVTGILLAVPVILSFRAMLQVIGKERMERQLASAENVLRQKNSGASP
ncbi:MAG: AI-2E family transporter [Clostridiales bacterium]|nr:AI-2E family transporter [Clostridiales bacterium]